MAEYVIDLTGVEARAGVTGSDRIAALWGVPLRDEVVRCRDCKYCRKHDMRSYGGDRDQLLCHHFSMSSVAGWPVEPEGFCKWGVRREEDE